ncbi:hypothetical protein bmyco0003_44850 [Bacillus pseudomycoides]|nr:hypothetical protein bmyco0003_44850 [Bacillus pseudomycoides]
MSPSVFLCGMGGSPVRSYAKTDARSHQKEMVVYGSFNL